MKTSFTAQIKVFLVFTVAIILFLYSNLAMAEGDPAGDAKLNELQMDIKACQQPGVAGAAARLAFSEKYNVPISEVPIYADNKDSFIGPEVLCSYEVNASKLGSIGTAIWNARALTVNYSCNKFGTTVSYALSFCIAYSEHCDHWKYNSDCAKQKLSSCIKK